MPKIRFIPASAALSNFLPDADARTRRGTITTALATNDASGSEAGFSGFSASDLTGATIRTVATAAELQTQLGTDLGANQTTIIECDWDGESTFTPAARSGPSTSVLTANGSVDYGFNRYGSKVLIRSASGRTPTIKVSTPAQWVWWGPEWVEFRDVTLDGIHFRFNVDATRPSIGIFAFNGCTIQNATDSASPAAIGGGAMVRTIHVEDCIFSQCRAGVILPTQFARYWNNSFKGGGVNDIFASRGHSAAYTLNWDTYTWLAGNAVFAGDTTLDPFSGDHPDFFHFSQNSTSNPNSWNNLMEFNYFHINRGDLSEPPQGVFSERGPGIANGVYHNNAMLSGAELSLNIVDAEDGGYNYVGNNHGLRQGNGEGDTASSYNNSVQRIRIKRDTGETSLGTGAGHIVNNIYGNVSEVYTQQITSLTRTGNEEADASQTTGATWYGAKFAGSDGSGGGFVTNVHPAGQVTYDLGETTADDKAAAIAKFRAFFTPQGGSWITAAADGAGAVDPFLWPAHPTDLVA